MLKEKEIYMYLDNHIQKAAQKYLGTANDQNIRGCVRFGVTLLHSFER